MEIPGYMCNRLRLLSQNSFEDDELPVQVKNRICSHCFRHELRTFQRNTFQDMLLDSQGGVPPNIKVVGVPVESVHDKPRRYLSIFRQPPFDP